MAVAVAVAVVRALRALRARDPRSRPHRERVDHGFRSHRRAHSVKPRKAARLMAIEGAADQDDGAVDGAGDPAGPGAVVHRQIQALVNKAAVERAADVSQVLDAESNAIGNELLSEISGNSLCDRYTPPCTSARHPAAGQTGRIAVEFRDYLKERCRVQGISLHRLALLCELNQIYFYQAVNKNKDNPPPWVLRRAAPHLGVTYVDLLIAAGYLKPADITAWERGAETTPVTATARRPTRA